VDPTKLQSWFQTSGCFLIGFVYVLDGGEVLPLLEIITLVET